jgi:hypothetical protein
MATFDPLANEAQKERRKTAYSKKWRMKKNRTAKRVLSGANNYAFTTEITVEDILQHVGIEEIATAYAFAAMKKLTGSDNLPLDESSRI